MKKSIFFLIILIVSTGLFSCSLSSEDDLLNPDKPITVTVWHYYNGTTKASFDELVNAFNDTVGMEKGIVIDAQSQGDVNQLAEAVFDAANESIGAMPMPNIFASYPDNAFRVHDIKPLVDLEKYFSQEELESYRREFLEEGRFITDNLFYIVPIAKSSENLYVNKNIWEDFSVNNNFTEDDLSTWEGLYYVAEEYFKQTGKAFFSLDANANYVIAASEQLNQPLYTYKEDGQAEFHLTDELGRKIWDYYYRPYLLGYFMKSGRFSSDDAKTGDVVCYTGSTAGAPYFPKNVAISDDESMVIEPLVLPYPYFEGGEKISIQQGAGMSISQSDEAHEYASAIFLKWFTEVENNLNFAVSTGYFPSKNAALEADQILDVANRRDVSQGAIIESIKASIVMFEDYTFYNNKPFWGSYNMRVLLDTFLLESVQNDIKEMIQAIESGEDPETLKEFYLSESNYQNWMNSIKVEAEKILDQVGNE